MQLVHRNWPFFLEHLSWWELKRYFNRHQKSVVLKPKVDVVVKTDYETRPRGFWGFVERWALPLLTDRHFDDGACDWADFQLLDGKGCHVGEKLKAAMGAWATVSRERGCLPLSRYKKVLSSWKKNAPKQSRLPMPE